MFCKRGIYINWGNIPHLEFDFGPINLFSGGNGSGKTTAADGLQSLMTAAYENLFTYNPGQDETTQKGRGGKQVRTLASYVLGCDDGSYARTRMTDGYVAAVFHPTAGENGTVFSAVMGVRAKLDSASSPRQSRQEDIIFLIIPNHELSLQHFIREEKSGKYVLPITDIANSLKQQFGNTAVEVYDKKSPYLRRLYGAFRGLNGAVSDREAKHAARTFSNFMAYKPVKSISEFVAKEILEQKDLSEDIRQVSELMKTIHNMDEETRYLNQAIGNLENAQHYAEQYIQLWLDHCVGDYTEISRKLFVKQQDYLSQKDKQRNNQESISSTDIQLKKYADKKQLIHAQLVELEAQRQGVSALKDKDQLDKDIDAYKKQLIKLVAPLLSQDQQFNKNYQAAINLHKKLQESSLAIDIPSLDKKTFRQSLKAVVDGPSDTGLNTQQLLTKDWIGISALEHKLNQVNQLENKHAKLSNMLHGVEREIDGVSMRDQLFATMNKRKEQLAKIKQQLNHKEQEIKQLQNLQISYPPHVESAINAILQQCPQAKPTVLCDFIEVTDPTWQMAIEGYIGGARFSILVEPECEDQAIRIVRDIKASKNTVRIIQGTKAQRDAAKRSTATDSIIEVMEFDHKIAEYFIKACYGNVVRVDNEKTLTKTARGITADGLGSGNYSLFRCDLNDANLVFGRSARERALNAKLSEQQSVQQQAHDIEKSYHQVARVHELVNQIEAIECTSIISEMLAMYQKLQMAENQLVNLDLSNFEQLEDKLQQLRDDFTSIEDSIKTLNEDRGGYSARIKQIEHAINETINEQEELQALQQQKDAAVLDAGQIYPRFDSEAALKQADAVAMQAKSDFNFSNENRSLQDKLDKSERALYEAIINHNQTSNAYNDIVYLVSINEKNDSLHFKHITQLSEQIAGVYNSLKNNVLVGKHEQLCTLKDSFNTAFVTNLCHSIYQSINEGKRVLEELNKELELHVFGSDQERFSFGWDWVAEFQEYWKFFKEVIEIPNLGDGSTLFDAQLSSKACQVRDKLLSMLLDKDSQYALRELQRISDFRNYRSYEIYKQPLNKERIALSKYGTGSGGQLETPAYIIRSAAVTSAFHFDEGSSHCRMVLVDEAFSKMDETRSREVINYLTQALGLQLIFIMPTSKSGPFMDLISNQVVFTKCPTTEKIGELGTRVLVDRKVCNQEKIKQLWANHRKTIRQQAMLDFMEEIN